MYNGVKAMIQKEKELTPIKEVHKVEAPSETLCGNSLKSPEDLKG